MISGSCRASKHCIIWFLQNLLPRKNWMTNIDSASQSLNAPQRSLSQLLGCPVIRFYNVVVSLYLGRRYRTITLSKYMVQTLVSHSKTKYVLALVFFRHRKGGRFLGDGWVSVKESDVGPILAPPYQQARYYHVMVHWNLWRCFWARYRTSIPYFVHVIPLKIFSGRVSKSAISCMPCDASLKGHLVK